MKLYKVIVRKDVKEIYAHSVGAIVRDVQDYRRTKFRKELE